MLPFFSETLCFNPFKNGSKVIVLYVARKDIEYVWNCIDMSFRKLYVMIIPHSHPHILLPTHRITVKATATHAACRLLSTTAMVQMVQSWTSWTFAVRRAIYDMTKYPLYGTVECEHYLGYSFSFDVQTLCVQVLQKSVEQKSSTNNKNNNSL